jgi:hypothetical protein
MGAEHARAGVHVDDCLSSKNRASRGTDRDHRLPAEGAAVISDVYVYVGDCGNPDLPG